MKKFQNAKIPDKTEAGKNQNFQAGLTLTEMLIAISIGILMVAAALSVYLISQKSYKKGVEKIELNQNARIALERISRELRQTKKVITALPLDNSDPENPPPAEIAFQDNNYSKIRYIRYYLVNNNLNRQIYHYYQDNPDNWVAYDVQGATYQLDEDLTVANQITNLQFYGSGTITINLIAQSASNRVSLTNKVTPRNQ